MKNTENRLTGNPNSHPRSRQNNKFQYTQEFTAVLAFSHAHVNIRMMHSSISIQNIYTAIFHKQAESISCWAAGRCTSLLLCARISETFDAYSTSYITRWAWPAAAADASLAQRSRSRVLFTLVSRQQHKLPTSRTYKQHGNGVDPVVLFTFYTLPLLTTFVWR